MVEIFAFNQFFYSIKLYFDENVFRNNLVPIVRFYEEACSGVIRFF
jgi:hypothetical protein